MTEIAGVVKYSGSLPEYHVMLHPMLGRCVSGVALPASTASAAARNPHNPVRAVELIDERWRPRQISSGDGSVTAFQRIRQRRYQIGTVAEPLRLQG